eukprot:11475836-Prorocentrum_lima.AAC.1
MGLQVPTKEHWRCRRDRDFGAASKRTRTHCLNREAAIGKSSGNAKRSRDDRLAHRAYGKPYCKG